MRKALATLAKQENTWRGGIVKRIVGELHFWLSRREGNRHSWATEQAVGERGKSRFLRAAARDDKTGALHVQGCNEALTP